MTAIIIEDEALAARELESILKKLAPEIEIVARQDSVRGSVQWLKENQVDLIFSDVHLGDGRSFDIFGQVEIKAPVIFITAYDEYALQAFKSQGIDYILKPFDEEEILRALEKVRNWFAKEKKAPRTVRFQERFLVQIGTKIKSVPVAEVAYFMADGKYLMLYTHEGGGYILDQTMAALEERLDPQIFFRINRKFIVSFSAIKEVIQRHNNKNIPDENSLSGIFCYCWKGDYFPLISSRISCICSWQPPQPVPAFVASPTSSTVFNPFSLIAFSISSLLTSKQWQIISLIVFPFY